MAAPTNTLVTGAMVGIREDLQEAMEEIDPSETPFYSNAPKGPIKNRLYDWLVDEFLTVDTTPRPEGNDAPGQAVGQPVRKDNVAQIVQRDGRVSGTSDVVDTAGRGTEKQYHKLRKAIECRRDWETILLRDQAKDNSDPRIVGSLSSWITAASVGLTGTIPTGDGSDIPGAGTDRDLTLDLIDGVNETAYNSGGNPTFMLMAPRQKRKFSALARNASNSINTVNTNEGRAAMASIIGAVDMYVTDFGNLGVVVDRFCPNERIYGLDRGNYKVTAMKNRAFISEDLAKTGDSEHFQVVHEGGLKTGAPKAHFAVYDLNT